MTGSNRWQGVKARLQSELGQLATILAGAATLGQMPRQY